MPRPRTKLPRKTTKDRLDQLIDYYDKLSYNAGATIPVRIAEKTLDRFATRSEDKSHWLYRGRKLIRDV